MTEWYARGDFMNCQYSEHKLYIDAQLSEVFLYYKQGMSCFIINDIDGIKENQSKINAILYSLYVQNYISFHRYHYFCELYCIGKAR